MNLFTNLHNLISSLYKYIYVINLILYMLKLTLILRGLFMNTLLYLTFTQLIIEYNLGV